MKNLLCVRNVLFLKLYFALFFTFGNAAEIVIQSQKANPTLDTPQSKVWYARGTWWAWLPYGDSGGRIWRRGSDLMWVPEQHLDQTLLILPGKADVWVKGDLVAAALVEGVHLAVQALYWSETRNRYEFVSLPLGWKEDSNVETITIDREGENGPFWVVYPLDGDQGRKIIARKIKRNFGWPLGDPVVLAEELDKDDICAVTAIDSSVGVMWSDQKKGAFFFRRHVKNAEDSLWTPVETVAQGNKSAEEKINFCRPPAGKGAKLLAVTKTTLENKGQASLCLLVLDQQEHWRGVPFAKLTENEEPSHPVVLWIYGRPVALYTLRGPSAQGTTVNRIMLQEFSPDGFEPVGEPLQLVMRSLGVDNVTGPKRMLENMPCLVFASNHQGMVIEAVIRLADEGS